MIKIQYKLVRVIYIYLIIFIIGVLIQLNKLQQQL